MDTSSTFFLNTVKLVLITVKIVVRKILRELKCFDSATSSILIKTVKS